MFKLKRGTCFTLWVIYFETFQTRLNYNFGCKIKCNLLCNSILSGKHRTKNGQKIYIQASDSLKLTKTRLKKSAAKKVIYWHMIYKIQRHRIYIPDEKNICTNNFWMIDSNTCYFLRTVNWSRFDSSNWSRFWEPLFITQVLPALSSRHRTTTAVRQSVSVPHHQDYATKLANHTLIWRCDCLQLLRFLLSYSSALSSCCCQTNGTCWTT